MPQEPFSKQENLARARQKRQRQALNNDCSIGADIVVAERVSAFRLVPRLGTRAHQFICSVLKERAPLGTDKREPCSALFQHLLHKEEFVHMSFTALANTTGVSRFQASQALQRTAAAMQLCADLSWGTLLANVSEMLDTRQVKGLCFLVNTRYDETPSKMRLGKETSVAKVFQIELGITMLFQRLDTKAVCCLTGTLPRMLAAVDQTTAANTRQVLEARCNTPELKRASRHLDFRVRCVCTDRYAANFAAEAAMQASARDEGLPYARDHTACEMHMVATAHTKTAQLGKLDATVQGLVACALTMTGACAKSRLQKCLLEVFKKKCIFIAGRPPGGHVVEFRNSVYDQCLPLFPEAGQPDARALLQNGFWV